MNFAQVGSRGPQWQLAITSAYDGLDYSEYVDRCTECNLISIRQSEYKNIAIDIYKFQILRYHETSVNEKYRIE